MFGSGEKTVAPTSVLPSRSFCFAVLKIRADPFCCCPRAPCGAISGNIAQIAAMQIAISERGRLVLIGFSLRSVALVGGIILPLPSGVQRPACRSLLAASRAGWMPLCSLAFAGRTFSSDITPVTSDKLSSRTRLPPEEVSRGEACPPQAGIRFFLALAQRRTLTATLRQWACFLRFAQPWICAYFRLSMGVDNGPSLWFNLLYPAGC